MPVASLERHVGDENAWVSRERDTFADNKLPTLPADRVIMLDNHNSVIKTESASGFYFS